MKNDQYTPTNRDEYKSPLADPIYYAIRLKGLIDPHWDWLGNLTVTHLKQGETVLYGSILDQAALHGLLARIRDLNLTLLSVNQIDPDDKRKEELDE